MKLRHPLLIKAAAFSASWALKLWLSTLRFRYRPLGPDVDPRRRQCRERYIYAFWHENLLLPAYLYGRRDIHVLISQHADGQMIAEVCRHMGFRTVRGSTTRDSLRAVRQMLHAGQNAHLGITPDGPRGPRRELQPGLIYLASRTGLPIVLVGIAFDRPWRARSWDRFALPRPWTLATCVTAEPIVVPPDAGREELEDYRTRVGQQLTELTAVAERLARPVKPLSPEYRGEGLG
jgi:lysophospholipid acyltransferase (LPLAT)-like uncharacterized protein